MQYLRSKGFTDDDLFHASLAKKSANSPELYAFFRNRIMFPIYDLMKNVIGFTARSLDPNDQPKYLNSSEHKAFEKSKILYGLSHAKSHINQFQKLIVVEGQMDVIGLHRLGFPIGVATSGTALTEDHIKILKRHTEHLYFLFDNDTAGQQATFRAMKLCYHHNLFPKIVNLPPETKDVDELANLEHGKERFESCLQQAQDGFLALFDQIRASSDMSSPIDKQKLINAMFELIISVSNLTIQEHYKLLLAEKLGFAPEIIKVQFQNYRAGEGKFLLRQQERQETSAKPPSYQPQREALFAALFYQGFLEKLRTTEQAPTEEAFVQALLQFANQIAVAVPESSIAKVLTGTLTEPEKEEMSALQLRWEKELGELGEETTKKAVLQRVISPNNPGQPSPIMEYFKMASKSPHLSNEEKMQLNKLKNTIGKK
ncbi:MAG: toprim domain-containing protein [Candidatus Peribacteria bacterium]|nr:toprim domain-containing protein [Candidatus Peribacteria bacterium]